MAQENKLDDLKIHRPPVAEGGGLGWTILVVALVVGLAGFGVVWFLRQRPARVHTAIVRAVSREAGARTVLNASGYVVARREATVSSKITGKVVEVLVDEGMKVEAGQVLARLDNTNTLASLQLAEAQQEAAKIALAETDVRIVEADQEFNRISGLAKNHVSSQSDLDHAVAELNSLKAHLEEQKVEVSVAERQVALWQRQMDDAIIVAPFAGIVTSKNAEQGEMISPMSAGGFTRTGICTLVDMNSLEIEVDVNESYIGRVGPGQPVEATLDAYPESKIPAKVLAIIPTADRQKATVKVRVGFDKIDSRILPEMGVKVAFHAADEATPHPRAAGAMMPKAALQHEAGGSDVAWIFQEGKADRRAITAGETDGDDLIVVAGLAGGEKVITDPPSGLKSGDRLEEMKP